MEDDWAKTDNAQFADMGDFDDSKTVSFIFPDDTFHSVRDNIFQQPKKEENNLQRQDNDMM